MMLPMDALPPEYVDSDLDQHLRREISASRRVVVALDDDPTGVQTVHDVPVLTVWDRESLAAELTPIARGDGPPIPQPLFFILTNSRGLTESEATRLNEAITREVAAARDAVNSAISDPALWVDISLASRSDSTLRGHFPAETDAIARALGGVDGVLLVPAFFEGGRFTFDDTHYVRDGDRLIPASETEFARDVTFGFSHSDLRDWVAEKTNGRVQAADVESLSLAEIRGKGPECVAERLREAKDGRVFVVNAACYADLAVVALGVVKAEGTGKRFVYRTAASFVRARAGITARPLLTRADLLGQHVPPYLPGLVVVGSHVRRSGEQLARLLDQPRTAAIEMSVPEILADVSTRDAAVRRAGDAAHVALRAGQTAVIFTSRRVEHALGGGEDQLTLSQTVSGALVAAVRRIDARPGFVVGKGGITSSDIGTRALEARRAIVLGQIRPGVPVWRLGDESRYPGLPYVVFPGNVGEVSTLGEVVTELSGG